MWVSKIEWNSLHDELNKLEKYKKNIERSIISANQNVNGVLVEDVLVIHRSFLHSIENAIAESKKDAENLKDENLKLIAERDWYKLKYAELLTEQLK